MFNLILASTSKYKIEQMKKLGISFSSVSPKIDEDAEKSANLKPLEYSESLAFKKSQSLIRPNSVIVSTDQIVECNGKIIEKPHTLEKAIDQIQFMQGKTHQLITSLCVLHVGKNNEIQNKFMDTVICKMQMRKLDREQIKKYLELDKPFDCAGSYKIESYGISLFEKIECDDFTAIQGLPLITVANRLRQLNINVLSS